MLVLSRKLHERIVLPTVNTSVEVVEIKRGVVRLGIDAPRNVPVLREEIAGQPAQREANKACPEDQKASREQKDRFRQQLRERLKTMGLGLGLARVQLDAGMFEEAQSALARIQDEVMLLRYGVEGEMGDPPPKPRISKRTHHKALLVEDEHNERELLAGFLRQSGLDVDTAGDGSDALDYLGSHGKPDVILLDMGLPRVDGPSVVREVRRNPAFAGLTIFGVSGHLPEEFNLEYGPRGIDRWFQKPLDPAALLHDLTETLDGSLYGA
jgi:two-component system, OmpR family, response regulator